MSCSYCGQPDHKGPCVSGLTRMNFRALSPERKIERYYEVLAALDATEQRVAELQDDWWVAHEAAVLSTRKQSEAEQRAAELLSLTDVLTDEKYRAEQRAEKAEMDAQAAEEMEKTQRRRAEKAEAALRERRVPKIVSNLDRQLAEAREEIERLRSGEREDLIHKLSKQLAELDAEAKRNEREALAEIERLNKDFIAKHMDHAAERYHSDKLAAAARGAHEPSGLLRQRLREHDERRK
jgi:DNA repair exonuclease SbcCD ATPase subunit